MSLKEQKILILGESLSKVTGGVVPNRQMIESGFIAVNKEMFEALVKYWAHNPITSILVSTNSERPVTAFIEGGVQVSCSVDPEFLAAVEYLSINPPNGDPE